MGQCSARLFRVCLLRSRLRRKKQCAKHFLEIFLREWSSYFATIPMRNALQWWTRMESQKKYIAIFLARGPVKPKTRLSSAFTDLIDVWAKDFKFTSHLKHRRWRDDSSALWDDWAQVGADLFGACNSFQEENEPQRSLFPSARQIDERRTEIADSQPRIRHSSDS